MLRQLDDELWVAEQTLRIMGLELGTRMSVVRLSDGGLFLHSPITLTQNLRKQLEGLGPVRCIVAPNKVHHFFLAENASAFPEARVYAAPGLGAKLKQLPIDVELGDDAPPEWSADLGQVWVKGAPHVNEIVFHHVRSRTLILTDLAFNVREASALSTRIFMRLNGALGHFGPTRLIRTFFRDRPALRASMDRVLAWDFDRVIVSHGEVLESGGCEALRESYAWL